MSDDVLARYTPREVAAWYGRLADTVAQKQVGGQVPLAAEFLRAYLRNRDPDATIAFPARAYLSNNEKVIEALRYHRRVFLSEEEARIGKGKKVIAGIVPRLKDRRWSGDGPLEMEYESLVEFGSGAVDILRIQTRGTPEERDLFHSLRGFQLKSKVRVNGKKDGRSVAVTFVSWEASGLDKYDWNYNEYLTMPNPDFGENRSSAIEPKSRQIKVYHKNARRIEDEKLAAPYRLVIGPWRVTAPSITGPATVAVP